MCYFTNLYLKLCPLYIRKFDILIYIKFEESFQEIINFVLLGWLEIKFDDLFLFIFYKILTVFKKILTLS
jgi:hypothetical protein